MRFLPFLEPAVGGLHSVKMVMLLRKKGTNIRGTWFNILIKYLQLVPCSHGCGHFLYLAILSLTTFAAQSSRPPYNLISLEVCSPFCFMPRISISFPRMPQLSLLLPVPPLRVDQNSEILANHQPLKLSGNTVVRRSLGSCKPCKHS